MILAYADPPYLGQGKRKYKQFHADAEMWDSVEAHAALLAKLDSEYDGWAFSMTSTSLKAILPFAPENCRVGAWVKPFASWKPTNRVQYSWEPVLFRSARPKGDKHKPSVRDFHSANITLKKGLPGAKPDSFNRWILEILGYERGDVVEDLFPGTHSMARALENV